MKLTPFIDMALGSCVDVITLDYSNNPDFLNTIEEFCTTDDSYLPSREGSDKGGIKDDRVRKCDLRFFNYDHENEKKTTVFNMLLDLTSAINDSYFRFDLTGFKHLQWTEYDGNQSDHYSWHCDKFSEVDLTRPDSRWHRKLSFSLIMSDTDEFEGGDFCIVNSGRREKLEQKRGQLIVFPSWALHKVNPVTSGVRKSLVWWAVGPKFR
jgi:predicted 2-oxoglutarate/Fe(II)-dependent dioxygenase YbiX